MSSLQSVDAARHEYRVRGAQSGYPILGAILIAGILPLGYLASTAAADGPLWIFALLLLASGVWLLLWSTQTRLVLDGSRVIVSGVTGKRTFDTSEIEGYRTISTRNGSYQAIFLRDASSPIRLAQFATDDAYQAWFAQLADLDDRDRKALLEKISQDQELGATPEERLDALAQAKRRSIVASVVVGLAAAGTIFGGASVRLPCALVLAGAPLVIFSWLQRSPLLYGLYQPKADPRASLILPLILSGFGLFFGSMDLNLVDGRTLLVVAIPLGLVYVAMFYRAVRGGTSPAGAVLSLAIFAMFYGWGAAVAADTVADQGSTQTYRVHVLGKRVSRGSRSSTYYLYVEPWGPFNPPIHSIRVSGSVYRATGEGDLVCVGLHPGTLHAPWYALLPCDVAPDLQSP